MDNLSWVGKFLRIIWTDGTQTDYPARNQLHWDRLQRFFAGKKIS